MKPKKRTTIYDIAEKLNLNPSSVSRALNNSSTVNPATKKLILKTAQELNYQRNTLASNLRTGHSKTIGVIVPRINQIFFSNVIAGIEAVTYEQGYNLVICQSNELLEKEVQCVNTLINQHVDCIVISISVETTEFKHLQNIIDHNIQLIQFDRVADELETLKVTNDNEQTSFEAVSHIIKQGYTRIALLEGPQNLNIFRQRKNGYLRALQENNMPVIKELMKENAWTKELSANATRQLLSLPQPPDAIFASTSDFSALGVLEVATAMNVKVPNELGICGYSNEDFTDITSPSITTIDQFSFYMGKTVANLYFQEMENADTVVIPKVISIKPKLIIRSSTQKNS
ncbi:MULTISPECIES: LacI family DNA-binding transcriptional regulator [unclassified Mucilaginibacter]|uniref:LacI family DNA-binding transcriptional regulator n=1 Tax=unclassified Mucilaginibacter TaxID=2617802 RepID=UPI002AC98674|nr:MULTISPECIES: LacI family DNA-binding transcriptional regulator [unclassified Mucilaginibacter]MEB0260362.1 LacI family DNA-binding transcriptional regulator [Mucilaginibacter sp. 10I4]MEB0279401.1 LacI family DNA-binding transcriptional regulator [Mucilaginibacter sp. 10B2]MEB0300529.1 LacI family DNA-binding transcriptional regulator [Mucilaginibacter sp. 5C4]WPX21775.1 LacI family DNA-binding transcriptional regulator [Mucilaginibacter sp. 5C4]